MMLPRLPPEPLVAKQTVAIMIQALAADPEQPSGETLASEAGTRQDALGGDVFGGDDGFQSFECDTVPVESDCDSLCKRGPGDPATPGALSHGVANAADCVLTAGDIEGDPAHRFAVSQYHPLHLAVETPIEGTGRSLSQYRPEAFLRVEPERLESHRRGLPPDRGEHRRILLSGTSQRHIHLAFPAWNHRYPHAVMLSANDGPHSLWVTV